MQVQKLLGNVTRRRRCVLVLAIVLGLAYTMEFESSLLVCVICRRHGLIFNTIISLRPIIVQLQREIRKHTLASHCSIQVHKAARTAHRVMCEIRVTVVTKVPVGGVKQKHNQIRGWKAPSLVMSFEAKILTHTLTRASHPPLRPVQSSLLRHVPGVCTVTKTSLE